MRYKSLRSFATARSFFTTRRATRFFLASVSFATFFLACVSLDSARAGDEIELLSGAKVRGTLTQIDKAGRQVTFDATIGSKVSVYFEE